jgi:hypothetical protein
VIPVVAAEASRVHLQQRPHVAPSAHHGQRLEAGRVVIPLGVSDHDSPARRRRRPNDLPMRPAQLESELDQQRARAAQPDVGARGDPAHRRGVGGPDLLPEPDGRKPRLPRGGLGQLVERAPLGIELAADRRIRGETRQQEVWCRHQRADPFVVERAQRV